MKCVLVIEKGPRAVLCGVFNAGLEAVEYFSYPDFMEAARSLSADLAKKGLRPTKTLISIHSSLLAMRIVDIPIAERKKLREVVSLQADELFIKGGNGLIIEAVSLHNGRAVVVGVDKAELAEQLKALNDAGLNAAWAGPALLSKGLILKRLHQGDGTSALIDGDSITVIKSGEAVFFKHLDSIDDLILSVSALEADGIKVDKFYSAGKSALASKAGIETTDVGSGYEHTSLLAVALQFKAGMKESVDFLKWHIDPKEEGVLRSRLRLSFALVAALALSWGAYSYFRYQNISAESMRIDSAMQKAFGELFPGSLPKNPEYSLEVKIKEFQKERGVLKGSVEALKAMDALSEAAKGKAVRVYELEASGKRMNISSEAASFEEASAFREAASIGTVFKEVTILETKPGQSGRVRFTMSAELGE